MLFGVSVSACRQRVRCICSISEKVMSVHKLTHYVKPYDLTFDLRYKVWTKSVSILGNIYSFTDSDPNCLCTMIAQHIRACMSAYNCSDRADEEFIEFHAQDILPLTTSFLERLRRA